MTCPSCSGVASRLGYRDGKWVCPECDRTPPTPQAPWLKETIVTYGDVKVTRALRDKWYDESFVERTVEGGKEIGRKEIGKRAYKRKIFVMGGK